MEAVTKKARLKKASSTKRQVMVSVLALLLATRCEAVEINAPLKIFTFNGVHTETAMQAKNYQRVIAGNRIHGATYGFHDLVNLCAAYIFESRYREAKNACHRAAHYSSIATVITRYRGPDAWIAYSNHAIANALSGNIEAARRNIETASRRGGDAAVLKRNLAAIENAPTEAAVAIND